MTPFEELQLHKKIFLKHYTASLDNGLIVLGLPFYDKCMYSFCAGYSLFSKRGHDAPSPDLWMHEIEGRFDEMTVKYMLGWYSIGYMAAMEGSTP